MQCQNCGEREGTETWVTDGMFGFVHGQYQKWCKRCCTVAQLEHARKMAAQVVVLEQQLAALDAPQGEEGR